MLRHTQNIEKSSKKNAFQGKRVDVPPQHFVNLASIIVLLFWQEMRFESYQTPQSLAKFQIFFKFKYQKMF